MSKFNFRPTNRYILVEKRQDEKEQTDLNVFESFAKKKESEYSIDTCVSKSDDCKIDVKPGDTLVIVSKMLEELALNSEVKFHVILENYVLGVVEEIKE